MIRALSANVAVRISGGNASIDLRREPAAIGWVQAQTGPGPRAIGVREAPIVTDQGAVAADGQRRSVS